MALTANRDFPAKMVRTVQLDHKALKVYLVKTARLDQRDHKDHKDFPVKTVQLDHKGQRV